MSIIAKTFNVTADCRPGEHYMVNLDKRLSEIKSLVDSGKYFTINRARQYGKTTTLRSLNLFLQTGYYTVLIDFQMFGNAKFKSENAFSLTFASSFLRAFKRNALSSNDAFHKAIVRLEKCLEARQENFELKELFEELGGLCEASDKPIVLLIDEVDSATNHQVFLDFLAQLRACYIYRDIQATFKSVILAGVYDIKNLKNKINPDSDGKANSPWNIAADFTVDMSFTEADIARMLQEYENDHQTGMDIPKIAGMLYEYTSGYPFLVSRICKLIDEEIYKNTDSKISRKKWAEEGFLEAVRMLLAEKNTLFDSLIGKLTVYPKLDKMLRSLLFTGKSITYNAYEPAIDTATMFGFIKNKQGNVAIANRIFETMLYNLYLSTAEMQQLDMYKVSLQDKNQFIVDGHLNMRFVLERFALHFNDLYGDKGNAFIEEEGRKYFLLYLRPIINGTGNYYIESRTRELRRTDVIVDYRGEQFVIEMKIWHGNEYHMRGERQLIGYLNDYHVDTGYLISFNFNQNKQIGVHELTIDGKKLVEAIV